MRKIQYKFVMLKNKKAKQPYHWVCLAQNGQVRFHSENYTRKESMLNVITQYVNDLRPGIAKHEDRTGERGISA